MTGDDDRLLVGAYVDGFNLYYRGRDQFRQVPGSPRWRWLDIRALVSSFARWDGSRVDRVVYCTALRDRAGDPTSLADQRMYLAALEASGSVDHIEYGVYVSRVKNGLLLDGRGTRPSPVRPPAGQARRWSRPTLVAQAAAFRLPRPPVA